MIDAGARDQQDCFEFTTTPALTSAPGQFAALFGASADTEEATGTQVRHGGVLDAAPGKSCDLTKNLHH